MTPDKHHVRVSYTQLIRGTMFTFWLSKNSLEIFSEIISHRNKFYKQRVGTVSLSTHVRVGQLKSEPVRRRRKPVTVHTPLLCTVKTHLRILGRVARWYENKR